MLSSTLSSRGRFVMTAGGLGYLRPFPGTWGSIPPVVLAAVLMAVGWGPGGWVDGGAWVYNIVLGLLAIAATLGCGALGDAAEGHFGRPDPSDVVLDEVAGMCLPLMFLPAAAAATPGNAVFVLLLAFVCFRVVDILKPWPCWGLQNAPAGWGIVLDDLAAGVLAAVPVQIVARVMM